MTSQTETALPASQLCSCHGDAKKAYRAPQGWKTDPQYVFIARPSRQREAPDTPEEDGYFANPFRLGHDGDHEQITVRFENWARERLQRDPVYRAAVKALHGKTLVCYCAPKPCHGTVLLQLCAELNTE